MLQEAKLPESNSKQSPQSASQRSFRESLLAMLGVVFVVMMVALDQTVVGTALPTIVAELKGFDLYAWVATSYLLASVITVPIFGRLGDYFGRKYFVAASIVIFTLASALCGMSNTMLFLVLARGLQGIGGGMLVGTAFASVPDLFPEAHVRLRWQVILSSGFGIANAVGPSLGGFLTQYVGWRSVFYVNLPVGLLSLYFILRHMPLIRHHKAEGPIKLDWIGALLLAVSLGVMQLFVELLPKYGMSIEMLTMLAGSAVFFVALYFREKSAANPVLPFDMFRSGALASLFALSLLMGFIMFALLFYLPLLLQGGFGLSPNAAGLLITPMVACITVGSISNSRVLPRLADPRYMLYAGFILLGICGLGIATMKRSTPHAIIALYMLGSGLGIGFVMPNLTIFTQELAGRSHFGIATALIQSLRMVGGMLGTAFIGTVVNHFYVSRAQQAVDAAHANQWMKDFHDPQILINMAAQNHLLAQLQEVGQNGAALIESARLALVSSIHIGHFISIVVAILALPLIRCVPRVHSLRKAGQTAIINKQD
jgi:EmrB/QacA subfamily drug resistance transporter